MVIVPGQFLRIKTEYPNHTAGKTETGILPDILFAASIAALRSEERRVGKEC